MNISETKALNPCSLRIENNVAHLVANPNTDFICKYDSYIKDDASFYYFTHDGDFTIQGKITSKSSNAFDAVFLMVRQDKTKWIKSAVEFGVDGRYNVVSVITDSWSDDANGELLLENNCWLRISRKDDFFGLHYSTDGTNWRFVRTFGLKMNKSVSIGFGIQSPKGANSEGVVDELSISNIPVENFRDGS